MENKDFIFLEHTSDKKFQAFGKTLNECFINSANALKNIFFDGDVRPGIEKQIEIKGTDLENLMMNFLEEFLVLVDTEGFLLGNVSTLDITPARGLKKKSYKLSAVFHGDDIKNYKIQGHAKAITYNDMFVKEENGTWTSQVVVDV